MIWKMDTKDYRSQNTLLFVLLSDFWRILLWKKWKAFQFIKNLPETVGPKNFGAPTSNYLGNFFLAKFFTSRKLLELSVFKKKSVLKT